MAVEHPLYTQLYSSFLVEKNNNKKIFLSFFFSSCGKMLPSALRLPMGLMRNLTYRMGCCDAFASLQRTCQCTLPSSSTWEVEPWCMERLLQWWWIQLCSWFISRLSQCRLNTSRTTAQTALCPNSLRRPASSHVARDAWWRNTTVRGPGDYQAPLCQYWGLVFTVCDHFGLLWFSTNSLNP